MVVSKALFWTDLVNVFGLFVTDVAQSDYDHFSYDHLYAASTQVTPCKVTYKYRIR